MEKTDLNKERIALLKKGDARAFDAIYNQYCDRLFGFVLRYVKLEDDAAEIVQDVFFRLWENKEKITIYSSFEAFLFTMTYNTTISLIRKRIVENKYLEYLKVLHEFQEPMEMANENQYFELKEQIGELLEQLTPRQREIFKLSREEGLSLGQIAEKLDLSPNTVKNHLVSALNHLRKNLDNGLLISSLFFSLFF